MTDEYFMQKAIDVAKKSALNGGLPLGVVLIRGEAILASATSHVGKLFDPTAHGECYAIKTACKKLKTLDLSEFVLFTTLESCSMCLACASWCGIKRIVFGAYKEDIPHNPYEIGNYSAQKHGKKMTPLGGGKMSVTGGVLRKECAKLMQNIVNWSPTQ